MDNLQHCRAMRDGMDPVEVLDRLARYAGEVRGPLGFGVWRGKLIGEESHNVYHGPHLGVFNPDRLIAPFGPLHDNETEHAAALFVLAYQYAGALREAFAELQRERDGLREALGACGVSWIGEGRL